jgi:hypothetical protein
VSEKWEPVNLVEFVKELPDSDGRTGLLMVLRDYRHRVMESGGGPGIGADELLAALEKGEK